MVSWPGFYYRHAYEHVDKNDQSLADAKASFLQWHFSSSYICISVLAYEPERLYSTPGISVFVRFLRSIKYFLGYPSVGTMNALPSYLSSEGQWEFYPALNSDSFREGIVQTLDLYYYDSFFSGCIPQVSGVNGCFVGFMDSRVLVWSLSDVRLLLLWSTLTHTVD